MAVVMKMVWAEVTPAQYQRVRTEVDWEAKHPEGGIFHVAWFTSAGLNVLDVWETEGDCQRFFESRLLPVVKGKLNLPGEPKSEFFQVQAYFKP